MSVVWGAAACFILTFHLAGRSMGLVERAARHPLRGKGCRHHGCGANAGREYRQRSGGSDTFCTGGCKAVVSKSEHGLLEETRDLLRKEGYDAECMIADISNEDDCAALVNTAISKFGRVDILHNNVGIGGAGRRYGQDREERMGQHLQCQSRWGNADQQALTADHAVPEIWQHHAR